MSKKAAILRHINMRAVRAGFYSTVCRLPALRKYFNYYQDTISLEELAEPGSLRRLTIRPVDEYGLSFDDGELTNILKSSAAEVAALTVTFTMARLRDVTVLGSSGVTVSDPAGRVVGPATAIGAVARNWVVPRPLRAIEGDPGATYINLLGVRAGHRHFAHFFTDTMIPLMIYLKNRQNPGERVTCLVREDLSPVQRDAFRFLSLDYPGLNFQALAANRKMACKSTVHFVTQSPEQSRDNLLLRDYFREIRDLFMRHYGIKPASERKRIYVSRGDAVIRKVRNEKALKQLLARYGFESYRMGRLPFARQVELFASAEMVVAPHGAGLVNLMFCNPGVRVLEIFSDDHIVDWFALLARTMGLDYHFFVAGRSDAWRRHFSVSLAALDARLAGILCEVVSSEH